MFTVTLVRRGPQRQRNLLLWAAVEWGAVIAWPSNHDPISLNYTTLDWQLTLVIPGAILFALPLWNRTSSLRKERPSPSSSTEADTMMALMKTEDLVHSR
jgi:hypothetical protein